MERWLPERYVLGLDLGQAQDYTALSVLQKAGEEYHVRGLERFRLGTSYPAIVDRVREVLSQLGREDTITRALVIDATGVGAPVVDLFRRVGVRPVAITITGGEAVSQDPKGPSFRVPKRNLVATLQVLLQAVRLKVARDLPESATLVKELLAFRVKIDPATAHDSYAAWREGDHDDLVLSTALACWYGENHLHPITDFKAEEALGPGIDPLAEFYRAEARYHDDETWKPEIL